MLNKILLLCEGSINTKYHVITEENNISKNDSLAIVDNEADLNRLKEAGYAVLYIDREDKYVSGAKYITTSIEECNDEYFEMVFSRCKGLPLVVFKTDRTLVREMTVDDLPQLYELYDDEEVEKFVDKLYEYEEEKVFTEKYIENMYGFYGYGLWLVFNKKNNELIGRIGISIRDIDGVEERELGYIIKKEYRKQGYAKEVCEAVITYAGNNLLIDRLFIVSRSDNVASEKLSMALGFEFVCETVAVEEKYKIFMKST